MEERKMTQAARQRHFQVATANRHQRDYQNCFSLSAVNAVALAKGMGWEDSYRLLLKQSHRYGLLPTEDCCVRNMIREAGFVQVPHRKGWESYDDLCEWLEQSYPGVTHGLGITDIRGRSRRRVCAIRRTEQNGFVAMDTREESRRVIQLLLPWDEIGADQPQTDNPATIGVPRSLPDPSHEGYRYFQPNPRKHSTGDCVVRAYAAVFDVSWDESLEMIARANEYTTTWINAVDTNLYLTSENKFEYHEPMVIRERKLSGKAFCEYLNRTYRDGERIYARCGRSHVVGIVPVQDLGGKRYAIMDSWDSSEEKIGQFFVYRPEKKAEEKQGKTERDPLQLTVGMRLHHPGFGVGEVTALADGRAVIQFLIAGEKTLGAAWIQKNCTEWLPKTR